ncbi:MAG: ThuA domain-containing protein [Verrucomicrobia bacterium]|nr:ThuA domain-containing protein [Verrucomicrobiota bacterium]
MKQKSAFALALLLSLLSLPAQPGKPLRIFIRAGEKTHGPAGNGQHDGPLFLKEWKAMLNQRGATCDGAIGFPTAEQLENTDVLLMYSAEGGTIKPEDRANLDKFLKRGGGVAALHDSVCGNDPQWFKTIIGGAWEHGHSKWFEGDISFYYLDQEHPITDGCSNFDFDDEVYWDLHLMPEAKILAASWSPDKRNTKSGRPFPHIYDVIPQMWTYEKDNYRAFVCIPGHNYKSFGLPHFRAVILRGIAWAGKRDVNSLCNQEELASLRYPEGGPTAPEKAAAKLEVHPDFTIKLVAAEPLINKPIALDWDAAGRLWVAETPEYPNGRRGIKPDQSAAAWKDHGGLYDTPGRQERPAHDRISILRDTNGDGRMDKKDVFYEGLELVTGFVFYRDGVIVSQAPDILWLRDTNGDGKADKVEKLYTGLGTFDTHAVINNLRWGYDGWIYATHGYSGSDHVRNGVGDKDLGRINSGVVRFKPDGSAFEQYCSKGGNTWGLDFGWDNELFFTQPTSGDLLMNVVLPESVLARGKVGNTTSFKVVKKSPKSFPLMKSENLAYVQIDFVGSFTAAAGCAIYDGGTWPDEWRYSYFTTEPTINIVHHEVVTPEGVSYTANKTREAEFIGSHDLWFRPIETRIGLDGALYILDFYNQAVIHNDTRGPKHNNVNAAVRPDRDHYFGRIWRVDHKLAKTISVPRLDKQAIGQLIGSLAHPNRSVRGTAARLLREKGVGEKLVAFKGMTKASSQGPHAQIAALNTLGVLGKLDAEQLIAAMNDNDPMVRKNALQIAAENSTRFVDASKLTLSIFGHLKDPDHRTRLAAITALAAFPVTYEIAQKLIGIYPELEDPWSQSAVVAAAFKSPVEFIDAAMAVTNPDAIKSLVVELSRQVAAKQDAELAAQLVLLMANKPPSADALKASVFETLVKGLKAETVPAWTSELQKAFQSLLASGNPTVPGAALPLVARWDRNGALAGDVKSLVAKLTSQLNDSGQPDEQRAQVVTSLLAVRQMNAEVLPSVVKILGSSSSPALQRRVIESLGATADPSVGSLLVEAYPKLATAEQDAVFGQLIKRADWSVALVEALKKGEINLATLGPAAIHRLRTHSDNAVAQRANAVIDELRGPEVKEKNELIAKFTPLVEKPGNVENGHKLFTQNCATCHKFNGEGKDVAPDLTGMGAHGAAELLVHVLDPNRVVEPTFISYSVETKDGESFDGIIARENKTAVMLRNASGDVEVKTTDIKSRRNTGLSLMPNGFEALGGDGLRDLLGYICAGESKYRLLDLKPAFTADSRKGIYITQESLAETLEFRKFGLIKVGDVPFEIVNPAKTTTGNNVIVLKGGSGFAKTLAQKVEISNVGLKASKLHFLGGVGGWAWPCCGDSKNENVPVAKVEVQYADGQREEIILKNGVEFVDYINASYEVPGSKLVPDLVTHGQVRWFTKPLQHPAIIQKITLESFDNIVAPTFVGITAEVSDAAPDVRRGKTSESAVEPTRLVTSAATSGNNIRVLLVGGGSSHDFGKWFNQADTATLAANGSTSVNYTEQIPTVLSMLKDLDVLYLSNNQPMADPALRKGIFDFADSGKGLLLVHPALWYNWNDWPEYNRVLVGGGARGHDKYGEFEVTVTEPDHALMAGVPKNFKIADELYNFIPDEQGTPIQVLATGTSPISGKTFPVVWITKHSKARIVCITLGHDGKAHEHPTYKALLKNSLKWAAGR